MRKIYKLKNEVKQLEKEKDELDAKMRQLYAVTEGFQIGFGKVQNSLDEVKVKLQETKNDLIKAETDSKVHERELRENKSRELELKLKLKGMEAKLTKKSKELNSKKQKEMQESRKLIIGEMEKQALVTEFQKFQVEMKRINTF